MATVDNKKTQEIDTSEENGTAPARIIAGHDSTIALKDRLYKKLGYKKGGAMAPNMSQPLEQFEKLKAVRDKARSDKQGT